MLFRNHKKFIMVGLLLLGSTSQFSLAQQATFPGKQALVHGATLGVAGLLAGKYFSHRHADPSLTMKTAKFVGLSGAVWGAGHDIADGISMLAQPKLETDELLSEKLGRSATQLTCGAIVGAAAAVGQTAAFGLARQLWNSKQTPEIPTLAAVKETAIYGCIAGVLGTGLNYLRNESLNCAPKKQPSLLSARTCAQAFSGGYPLYGSWLAMTLARPVTFTEKIMKGSNLSWGTYTLLGLAGAGAVYNVIKSREQDRKNQETFNLLCDALDNGTFKQKKSKYYDVDDNDDVKDAKGKIIKADLREPDPLEDFRQSMSSLLLIPNNKYLEFRIRQNTELEDVLADEDEGEELSDSTVYSLPWNYKDRKGWTIAHAARYYGYLPLEELAQKKYPEAEDYKVKVGTQRLTHPQFSNLARLSYVTKSYSTHSEAKEHYRNILLAQRAKLEKRIDDELLAGEHGGDVKAAAEMEDQLQANEEDEANMKYTFDFYNNGYDKKKKLEILLKTAPNTKDKNDWTLLHHAAFNGDVETVRTLLRNRKVNRNAQCKAGTKKDNKTPQFFTAAQLAQQFIPENKKVHTAIHQNYIAIVDLLSTAPTMDHKHSPKAGVESKKSS